MSKRANLVEQQLAHGDNAGVAGPQALLAAIHERPHALLHGLILRREPVNVGTVQHVINAARAAKGDLMVVAAGDDVSYPDRVATLYAAWRESGAAAMASWHDEIDEEGKVLRREVSFPPSNVVQKMFAAEPQAHRSNGIIETIPGFSAAYPRGFWANLPDTPGPLLARVGPDGSFTIDNVPTGAHQVSAWAGGQVFATKTVEVGASGATAEFQIGGAATGPHLNKLGQPYGSYED